MLDTSSSRTLSLVVFAVIVAASLGITAWASRRARYRAGFYVAGRNLGAGRNGLAILGDLFSAASFLGVSGLVALNGFDGVMYAIGFVVALVTVLLVVAEPLRNVGQYTLTDVMTYGSEDGPSARSQPPRPSRSSSCTCSPRWSASAW